MQPEWLRPLRTVALLTLAYLGIDLALNAFFSDGWTIIWPLNGLNVALLIMRPRSRWPATLLGIELGTGIGECIDGNPLAMEIAQRACSVVEVLTCALILPAFGSLEQWLSTPRIFPRFFAALILGPGISGILAAMLFRLTQGQSLLLAFNNWATADALGVAAIMPLALSVRSAHMRRLFERDQYPKTLCILGFAVIGACVIFASRYPLGFLLYPLLLLVDSMLAFEGSALAIVAVCFISVYFTIHGRGPFGQWPDDLTVPRDLALQLYFGFHLLALFPASIVFMERRKMAEELHDSNARLKVLAAFDGLTGIANRRSFDERLAQEWSRAMRARETLGVAMIDLDNFKQYNDLYGHLAGDRCLCAVADVLSSQVQRPEDLVARFGGEEFALLLPRTTAEGARTVAERIRTAARALHIEHLGNDWNTVTVSVGYAVWTPGQADAPAEILQAADTALYEAKRAGRNCVRMAAPRETPPADSDSSTTRTRLKRLLARGEP